MADAVTGDLTLDQRRALARARARMRLGEAATAREVPLAREGRGVAGGAPRLAESPDVLGAQMLAKDIRENPVLGMTNTILPVRDAAQAVLGAVGGGVGVARNILGVFGFDIPKTNPERAVETLGREMGRDDASYEAGELAGEVVGLAKGAKYAARGIEAAGKALGASRVAAPLATAVETGGFRTGLAPTTIPAQVANQMLRVGVGGASGAAGAYLTDGDVATGAVIGAGLPPAASAVAKGFNRFVGTPLANVKAAQIMREALGPDYDRAVEALRTARPGVTAGQALQEAGIERSTFQSLEKLAQSASASEAYEQLARTQADVQRRVLEDVAGGGSEAQSFAVREAARGMVNAETAALREAELAAANQTTRNIMNARAAATEAATEAEGQTQLAKRMLGLAERKGAEAVAPVPAAEPGIGELPMMRGPEQRAAGKFAQAAEAQGEQAARLGRVSGNVRRAAETQLQEYADAGLKPLKAADLTGRLRGKMSDPAFTGNDAMQGAFRKVVKEIEGARLPDGTIDADALYAIRKNAVNSVMQRLSAGDPTVAKRSAEAAMATINPMIDDAIEAAGGKGWRDYLATHGERMQELVNRRELGARALAMYETDPQGFVRMVRGGKIDIIRDIFGGKAYNIEKEMGPQFAPLKKVADEIARDTAIRDQITDVATARAREIVSRRTSTLSLPRLIDYKVGIANDVSKLMNTALRRRVMTSLHDAMLSGRTAAEVFDLLPQGEQGAIERVFGGRQEWIDAMNPAFRIISQATIQAGGNENAMSSPPANAMVR